jgi:hypothetical protein
MTISDLYGLRTDDLELARIWVEEIIGTLQPHESSYIGEYYRLNISNKEKYILHPNFFDSDWSEEEYQHCGMLLYIYESPKIDKIRKELLSNQSNNFEFIRRTVITDDGWDREYKYIEGQDVLVSERNLADFD